MHPVSALVEARYGVKFAAAGAEKIRLALDGDFLERFQAVGNESRADHVDSPHILSAQLAQHFRGVRLEPLGAAKARLKCDSKLLRTQSQQFGEQARGLMAFAVVG